MDPRKFVVDPTNLSCQEVGAFNQIGKICKIGRWHCHPDLFFVEAIHFYDWVFWGTIMLPVIISEQEFLGVAVTQFDCEEGLCKTAVRTASIPVKVDDDTKQAIISRMVQIFTPVGRELKVLTENDSFGFETSLPWGHEFPKILEGFYIRWDGDPEQN